MLNLSGIIKKIGLFTLGCIILMLVIGFGNAKSSEVVADPAAIVDSVEGAGQQWDHLLSIAGLWTQDTMKATIKWQGEWNSLLAPEEAADVLSSRLGLSAADVELVQGHSVYSSYSVKGKLHTKLSVIPQDPGVYYVMLRMEAADPEQVNELTQLQLGYGEQLIDEGVKVRWNGALQGVALNEGDPSQLSETGLINTIENAAAQEFNMVQVESYDDFGTASRTYEVEGWPISIFSGAHKVSLQMGVHRNLDQNSYEISIGSPLLTVEY
ncbi:hypothetical protein D3C78_1011120 [compost metagenome]